MRISYFLGIRSQAGVLFQLLLPVGLRSHYIGGGLSSDEVLSKLFLLVLDSPYDRATTEASLSLNTPDAKTS